MTTWQTTPTKTIDVDGTSFAYRELGEPAGVPVVFLHHFTAVLDDWDPRVLDGVAAQHHVIAFDNRGVGSTGSRVPTRHRADGCRRDRVHQGARVRRGRPVRLLARRSRRADGRPAGARPGPPDGARRHRPPRWRRHLEDAVHRGRRVRQGVRDPQGPAPLPVLPPQQPRARRPRRSTSQRLAERTQDRAKPISRQAGLAQLRAITAGGLHAPDDLSVIKAPVLVANGDHDLMVASEHSADMARRLPDAKLVVYPNSGHGGVFQYHREFVPEVLAFLADR